MKEIRERLLSQTGFQDALGNTVVFSEKGWNGEPAGKEEIWLFLDEGLRCGGMHRKLPATAESIRAALLGCKKEELWQIVAKAIEAEAEGGSSLCFAKN